MNFFYEYKDRNGKTITSDSSSCFLTEKDFRAYRRKEMKQMPDVHYCEYYKLNEPRAKVKTIARQHSDTRTLYRLQTKSGR